MSAAGEPIFIRIAARAARSYNARVSSPKAPSSYAAAGVNISLGDRLKSRLPALLRRATRPEALGRVGHFGGLFALDTQKYRQPVLVSSVDSVGSKLKVAQLVGRHDTIGEDIVNHCCNDIAVLGAEPLFFLDYIGVGKLHPKLFHDLIGGLAKACAQAGCALIGGETAQLPDFYRGHDYELAGCIVGVVEKSRILDGSRVRVGDLILGLPSSGLHTNGYTLARKIFFEKMRWRVDDTRSELGGTLGNALLAVHRNYWLMLKPFLQRSHTPALHALAHITGGGFLDNIPRVLPKNCRAVIRRGSWPVLPIFQILQREGHIAEREMYRVFNMGIGMVLIVDADEAAQILKALARRGEKAYLIGEITRGKQDVKIL